jgi:protein O-GlcNAc transferase
MRAANGIGAMPGCWRESLLVAPAVVTERLSGRVWSSVAGTVVLDSPAGHLHRAHVLEQHLHLAEMAVTAGRYEDARSHLGQALGVDEYSAPALTMLGVVAKHEGSVDEAERLAIRALAAAPGFSAAWCLRGNLAREQRDTRRSLRFMLRAVRSDRGSAQAWHGLGLDLAQLGRHKASIRCFNQALLRDPEFTPAHNNLGSADRVAGRASRAIERYLKSLSIDASSYPARANIGLLWQEVGEGTKAAQLLMGALARDPLNITTLSNYLMTLNYLDAKTADDVSAAHQAFGRLLAAYTGALPRPPRFNANRETVRIGLLSADFRRHSVAMFVEPLLQHWPSDVVEVYCYSAVASPDTTTRRLRSYNVHWRDVSALGSSALARVIADDVLDVCLELGGHTAGNRLDALVLPVAPLVYSYLGYPNTVGIASVNGRLSDNVCDPPQLQSKADERGVVHLPAPFICFAPGEGLPKSVARTQRRPERFCFASFNNLAKIQSEVALAWAEILRRCPTAVLQLRSRLLADPVVKDTLLARMERAGARLEQIELLEFAPRFDDRLDVYAGVDLALDSFPYNGTTTTCEALAAGVPVLCVEGDRHVSRVGTSLLCAVGLSEDLVASDIEAYVERAVELAGSPVEMTSIRTRLVAARGSSSLFDGVNHAPALAEALVDRVREGRRLQPRLKLILTSMPDCGVAVLHRALRLLMPDVDITLVSWAQGIPESDLGLDHGTRVIRVVRDVRDVVCSGTALEAIVGEAGGTAAVSAIEGSLEVELSQFLDARAKTLIIIADWLGIAWQDDVLAAAEREIAGIDAALQVPIGSWRQRLSLAQATAVLQRLHAGSAQRTLAAIATGANAIPFRGRDDCWIHLPATLSDANVLQWLVLGDVNATLHHALVSKLGRGAAIADLTGGSSAWGQRLAGLGDSQMLVVVIESDPLNFSISTRSSLLPRAASLKICSVPAASGLEARLDVAQAKISERTIDAVFVCGKTLDVNPGAGWLRKCHDDGTMIVVQHPSESWVARGIEAGFSACILNTETQDFEAVSTFCAMPVLWLLLASDEVPPGQHAPETAPPVLAGSDAAREGLMMMWRADAHGQRARALSLFSPLWSALFNPSGRRALLAQKPVTGPAFLRSANEANSTLDVVSAIALTGVAWFPIDMPALSRLLTSLSACAGELSLPGERLGMRIERVLAAHQRELAGLEPFSDWSLEERQLFPALGDDLLVPMQAGAGSP